MTMQEWWAELDKHWDKLLPIIQQYHPSRTESYEPGPSVILAEHACENVRRKIRQEGPIGPTFAKETRNYEMMSSILSGTWFGVPETTGCWDIEGFRELVSLLEDPPDEGSE